jgi:ribosomal protein S18 acetylase RimI-like enzyme
MSRIVRALDAADVEAFRRIRLDALRLHPDAFGAAYEDEAVLDSAQFMARLMAPGVTRYGGFTAAGDLVGLVGLQMRTGLKEQHKARLFSMYVDAAHRRTALARQLVEAVIAGARQAGAVVLQLSVAAHNAPARGFYRRMGFTVYGVERRSLKVGERFHDEELMALDLD